MMPSDLIGSEILEENKNTGGRVFQFRKGPIFCQLLLADEVNYGSAFLFTAVAAAVVAFLLIRYVPETRVVP